MNQDEFEILQKQALERMLEMSKKSKLPQTPHNMPPTPDFIKLNNTSAPKRDVSENFRQNENKSTVHKSSTPQPPKENQPQSFLQQLNIPQLNQILNSKDSSLILILMILLWNEKSDKLLLVALAFILL